MLSIHCKSISKIVSLLKLGKLLSQRWLQIQFIILFLVKIYGSGARLLHMVITFDDHFLTREFFLRVQAHLTLYEYLSLLDSHRFVAKTDATVIWMSYMSRVHQPRQTLHSSGLSYMSRVHRPRQTLHSSGLSYMSCVYQPRQTLHSLKIELHICHVFTNQDRRCNSSGLSYNVTCSPAKTDAAFLRTGLHVTCSHSQDRPCIPRDLATCHVFTIQDRRCIPQDWATCHVFTSQDRRCIPRVLATCHVFPTQDRR